jgi:2,4-diketo-3-deoxy-L-fuconate hydrolase
VANVKVAAYIDRRGDTGVGVVRDGVVCKVQGFDSLVSLLEAGATGRDALTRADRGSDRLDEVTLLAPVTPRPRGVYCVGWNYDAHKAEGDRRRGPSQPSETVSRPTFFSKAVGALADPGADIQLHEELTAELDWEAELAVVIGREGRSLSASEVMDYVFGYTVANDVTARDVQRQHGGQWFKGKSLDSTCPVGPWIVTPDEVGDLAEKEIICAVNGTVQQRSGLDRMHFSVAQILAELSAGMTLFPGDLVLTGTPEGTGNGKTPPSFLRIGDIVESEVTGVGKLTNAVVGARQPTSARIASTT